MQPCKRCDGTGKIERGGESWRRSGDGLYPTCDTCGHALPYHHPLCPNRQTVVCTCCGGDKVHDYDCADLSVIPY